MKPYTEINKKKQKKKHINNTLPCVTPRQQKEQTKNYINITNE